jgi:hypothetical protein
MTPQERLTALIAAMLDPAAPQKPRVSADQCLLDVSDRSFHLGLNPERGEITFSTLVFYTDRDPDQIHADLIADFNAFHLFSGGYRLSVDPDTLCLYVSVTRSLDEFEKSGLEPFFADFIDRCMSCTRWYMDECSRRFAESIKPAAAMAV